jgi:YD repeat-containing protein
MTLALGLKSWHVKHNHKDMPDGSTVDSFVPTQAGWVPYAGYGAGYLSGRNYGVQTSSNLTCRWYSKTLSRLTFSAADGTEYDALGRAKKVTTMPDGAAVTTSYVGNAVTVTDQHDASSPGHSRKSVTDALGRLTSVYEDTSGLNYRTTYTYDVLGNLRTVTQGSQTRTFVYDSLSRLTSAINPESGTVAYTYDNNGNLRTNAARNRRYGLSVWCHKQRA